MRTNLFRPLFFLLAVIMLSACEKPILSEDDDAGKDTPPKTLKGNLILRVSGFEIIPFDNVTRTKQDLKDVCTSLCFAVYDQSDKKIAYKNQSASDSNFGQVGLELDKGTYQIVVVAHSGEGNPQMSTPAEVWFTNKTGFTDTYYYYNASVVVGDGQQSIDVVLEHAVAMFRLVTSDPVPDNAASIRVAYTGGCGRLNAKTGLGTGTQSQQRVMFDITESQKGKPITLELYTFPNEDNGLLKMDIGIYKENTDVIREVVLENVPIVRNKITQYTGYLFSDPPQGGGGEEPGGDEPGGETPVVDPTSASYVFPLKVETDWGGTIEKTF